MLTSQIDLKARARLICSPSEFKIFIQSCSLFLHQFSFVILTSYMSWFTRRWNFGQQHLAVFKSPFLLIYERGQRSEALDLPFLRCAFDLDIQWRGDLLMHLGSDDFSHNYHCKGRLAFPGLKFLPWQLLRTQHGKKMKSPSSEF